MLPGIVTHIAGAPTLSMKVTRELKQLVNISIAAGKFILIHPDYELIRELGRGGFGVGHEALHHTGRSHGTARC